MSPEPHFSLADAAAELNRIKRTANWRRAALLVTRTLVLALLTVSIWSLVAPGDELAQLALGALVMVLALAAAGLRGRRVPIQERDLALALEMKHGAGARTPIPSGDPNAALDAAWVAAARTEIRSLQEYERRRTLSLATTLVLPLAFSAVTLPNAAPSFQMALSEVSNAVSRLARGASLRVVTGAATEMPEGPLTIKTSDPATIELLAQNLVEVSVTGGFANAPNVELRQPAVDGAEGAVFQSFQMMPVRDDTPTGEEEAHRYSISFAISDPVDLHIPALGDGVFAHVKVRQLPTPKVRLTATSTVTDPWPDDQPLPLRIEVSADNPLQTVRLLIKSGQRVSKELVANVLNDDKRELSTEYQLILETYVESDIAQVELVAEATDRSLPTPLVGYSEPLRLNTASAYGRYRQTLETLKTLKDAVDEAVAKQKKDLPQEAEGLARKAADQSETSPFFDGLDRVQIHRFQGKIDEFRATPQHETLLDLSQGLNDFLFEHEILDDRERDRDFFVAARGLSRLLEQDEAKRPVATRVVTERIRKFLDDRQGRWAKRVERLKPDDRPPKWGSVRRDQPFHKATTEIDRLQEEVKTRPGAKTDQLTSLSKSVVEYRAFIEDLEAREDKARQAEERERQEGLASARDVLKELQQRQGEISADLDRAGERKQSEMADNWPAARMKQNTNLRETRQLEGQMRSVSPSASERIKAATQAMEATNEGGESGNFQLAESASDRAGRLLRQADAAAQQSQQRSRNRGRRRPVTGDNYYGQSVVGGDIEIKREYQVDRRYREDILDEVQAARYDEENRTLLENYLRHVIR